MVNVSNARKVGIAARIAGQQVKRSKTYGAVASGVRATLKHFAGVLHQLWLEITGFVFLAFAGVGLVALVREFNSLRFPITAALPTMTKWTTPSFVPIPSAAPPTR